jgi:hypothetical protein
MSAESTIIFYGVRLELPEEEITSLEERSHHLIVKARQNGLKFYWGNFAAKGNKYLLFIGDKLAVLGVENEREIQIAPADLNRRIQDTAMRLQKAQIDEQPMLYMAWQPDL